MRTTNNSVTSIRPERATVITCRELENACIDICALSEVLDALAHALVLQIFKIMNIFARARPSIARASAQVGPGLATPLSPTS